LQGGDLLSRIQAANPAKMESIKVKIMQPKQHARCVLLDFILVVVVLEIACHVPLADIGSKTLVSPMPVV
jgi:hypothetical protein